MKRPLLTTLLFLTFKIIFCQQTGANSFECQLKPGYQGFTQTEIISFISQSHFENFRLSDKRVTLTFDNGFDITLLSAKELQQSGAIKDISSYQVAFPANYKLPTFHINQNGQIAAAYPVNKGVKYSRGKR